MKRKKTLEGNAPFSDGWGTPHFKIEIRDKRLDFGERSKATLEGQVLSSVGRDTPNFKLKGWGGRLDFGERRKIGRNRAA